MAALTTPLFAQPPETFNAELSWAPIAAVPSATKSQAKAGRAAKRRGDRYGVSGSCFSSRPFAPSAGTKRCTRSP